MTKALTDKEIEALRKLIKPEPVEEFVTKYGEGYFYVDLLGLVGSTKWYDNKYDEYRRQQGNYFPTPEAAEYHRKMQDLAATIRERAFKPDWNDGDQEKWNMYIDNTRKSLGFYRRWSEQHSRTNFRTEDKGIVAFKGVSFEDAKYMLDRGMI